MGRRRERSCKWRRILNKSQLAGGWNYGECAGRPARSRWWKSTAMKEVRSTSAPSRASMFARAWAKRRLQERTGQPLRFDKNSNPDAEIVHWTEGKTDGARDRECPDDPAWSETHWHVRTLLVREVGDLTFDRWARCPPRSASGRRGAVADDPPPRTGSRFAPRTCNLIPPALGRRARRERSGLVLTAG
jgi:hypothetical protein